MLDALKNNCLGIMKECCEDDHLVTMKAHQMDAMRNDHRAAMTNGILR